MPGQNHKNVAKGGVAWRDQHVMDFEKKNNALLVIEADKILSEREETVAKTKQEDGLFFSDFQVLIYFMRLQ